MVNNPLWSPSKKRLKNSNLYKFKQAIENKYKLNFHEDFQKFWQWSVKNDEVFWSEYWDYDQFAGTKGTKIIEKNLKFWKNRFFPEAKLNFTQNLLTKKTDETAVYCLKENNITEYKSWRELYTSVCKFSSYLKSKTKFGDRVVAYVPNTIEYVVAFLSAAKNGNIWSSCSPDFGINGVVDRFSQIKPSILVTSDCYFYNGKKINLIERIPEIIKKIPSIKEVIVFNYDQTNKIDHSYLSFEKIIKEAELDEIFELFDFNHPVYILYSSGTTGKPKCIAHGAGNALIEQKKELSLHLDVKENDRVFYFTTTGWMMSPWQIAALACKASIYLYDGSPFYPTIDRLIEYCSSQKFTLFGVGAKYIDHLKNENFSAKKFNLDNLKTVTSTGSPLIKESFEFVHTNLKDDIHLASISGGTDVVGCLVLGNLLQPVYAGEIQGPSLGIDVAIYEESGKEIDNEMKGELVVKKPFPSMPVKFWNDANEEKIKKAYFNKFNNLWHHGDYIQKTKSGGYIIYGRSDATLKPGGVRIGTAEIYRQVENFEQVSEALVVGQNHNNDVRIVLFVKMRNQKLDDQLKDEIKKKIKTNCSPRHVPQLIFDCPDIPRTKSGKIVEIAVRKILNNESVENIEAIANPEVLEYFKKLPIVQTNRHQ